MEIFSYTFIVSFFPFLVPSAFTHPHCSSSPSCPHCAHRALLISLSALFSDKSHPCKCSFIWIWMHVLLTVSSCQNSCQPGSLTPEDTWLSSQTHRGWRGNVTFTPNDPFSLSQSLVLSPPLIHHLGLQPGCHPHHGLPLCRHFPCSYSQMCLSYHSHNEDAVQAISSHVLSPTTSFPGQTQPQATTAYSTCCFTQFL